MYVPGGVVENLHNASEKEIRDVLNMGSGMYESKKDWRKKQKAPLRGRRGHMRSQWYTAMFHVGFAGICTGVRIGACR